MNLPSITQTIPVIGQAQAIILLQTAIAQHRLAPAYLFVGCEGVGKGLTARWFSELILGLSQPLEKQTLLHQRMIQGNHPDFLWVEPTYQYQGNLFTLKEAQEKGLNRKAPPQIRLEQIRQITQFLSHPPLEATHSVVVIESAHTLTEGAANGLLKTLEEPGKGIIILLAPSPDVLLSTLVSRCQKIPFFRLSPTDLEQVLKQNCTPILEHPEIITLAQGSPGEAMATFAQFQQISSELRQGLTQPISHPLKALQLAKVITTQLDTETQLWLINYLQSFFWSQHQHPQILERLEQTRRYLLSYVQPRLVWECTLLDLISISPKSYLTSVRVKE